MKLKINELQSNVANPRIIKDRKFKKLVQSIKDSPWMLELRPIVIDENNIILGGNMRHKACIEAGLKEVPVKIAKGLTVEQKQEFIIKDNVSFGEWDWSLIGNEWSEKDVAEWGMDVWQTEDFFDVEEDDEKVSEPSVTDNDYGKFECIMLYENKIKLVDLLSKIAKEKDIKLEYALMCLVENYSIKAD
jgi:hypothetical protein